MPTSFARAAGEAGVGAKVVDFADLGAGELVLKSRPLGGVVADVAVVGGSQRLRAEGVFLLRHGRHFRVRVRGSLEPSPACHGEVDFSRRNGTVFHKAVRQDRGRSAVEEVKHPVVDALQPDAELIDVVPQIIGLGSPQLMAKVLQAFEPG